MDLGKGRLAGLVLLMLAPFVATAPAPAPPAPGPVRQTGSAFGQVVEIGVEGLDEAAARPAIRAALDEVSALERLADPDGDAAAAGSLAAFNAAAGKGAQPVDARLLAGLARALDFCVWSEKGYGPLGRDLNRLWGLRKPVAKPPQPGTALDQALAAASCDRLQVDVQKGIAGLAAGSGADLWGFAEGMAVDRAVEVLRLRGARNGVVRIGGVYRGFGPGPDGKGWSVGPLSFPGMTTPLSRIYLRDRALAVVAGAPSLKIGEAAFSPWLSHRTGQPAEGSLAVLAWSELALDAQGLASTLTVISSVEGQLRLGSLRPKPSVLWLKGSGAGEPLQIDYNWGDVPKR